MTDYQLAELLLKLFVLCICAGAIGWLWSRWLEEDERGGRETMTQDQTTVDLTALAEAMLADIIQQAPSALVAVALSGKSGEIVAVMERHLANALTEFHGQNCLMAECLCEEAVREMTRMTRVGRN